jgi:hypothetical protein
MSEIPNLGSVVRVTTKHIDSYLYAKEKFQYFTHEGTVVPSEKWVNNGFTLTGDKNIKLRVVSLDSIEKIEYITGKGQKAKAMGGVRVFKVKSKSKGSTYMVTLQAGKFSCDCLGFQYRRNCRHTAAARTHVSH